MRAMWRRTPRVVGRCRSPSVPHGTWPSGPRPPGPGVVPPSRCRRRYGDVLLASPGGVPGRAELVSALALLVPEVVADDHDPPVTADHLALRADALDARLDLHDLFLAGSARFTCSGRRSGRATGRTATAPRRPCPRGGFGCSAVASSR